MGIRIIHDEVNGLASLYCSSSDHSFGPVFYADKERGTSAYDEADSFIEWCRYSLDTDLRFLSEAQVSDAYYQYRIMKNKITDNNEFEFNQAVGE